MKFSSILFNAQQIVTFKFYVGKLSLFDGDYEKAEQNLKESFERCERSSWNNKRNALLFLLPLELNRGLLPTSRLLDKYSLTDLYQPFVNAMRVGDARAFEGALSKNMDFFVQRGVYLLLERLRFPVYRSLFRRAWFLCGKPTRLKLDILLSAMHFAGYAANFMFV